MKILRDCLFFTLSAPLLLGAGPKDYSANPDFTKGGTIPKGATHDWQPRSHRSTWLDVQR